jgi:DnaK suppressor protein
MHAIKQDLEDQRHTLNSAIQSSMGPAREFDHGREFLKDPYGSASLAHDDEIAAAVVERQARELEEVSRALEDLEAGRYGVCRDCSSPISAARLRVRPSAIRCVACQAQFEAAASGRAVTLG